MCLYSVNDLQIFQILSNIVYKFVTRLVNTNNNMYLRVSTILFNETQNCLQPLVDKNISEFDVTFYVCFITLLTIKWVYLMPNWKCFFKENRTTNDVTKL